MGGDGEALGLDALGEHLASADEDGIFFDEERVEGGEGGEEYSLMVVIINLSSLFKKVMLYPSFSKFNIYLNKNIPSNKEKL